mgnify:CR=1 FL=1
MVTAVSTIANKGVRMKPRVVKQIIDPKTGEVQELAPKQVLKSWRFYKILNEVIRAINYYF